MPLIPEPLLALLHAWQVRSHALSQHTPSTQRPEAHAAASGHGCPLFEEQTPSASQVLAQPQVAGSAALTTGAQLPSEPGTPHDWQAPLQRAVPQQKWSTQKLDTQSIPEVHGEPFTPAQTPSGPHAFPLVQLSGSGALVSG